MTLEDFMKIKHPNGKTKSITAGEAKAFGLNYSSDCCKKGWFKRLKHLEMKPGFMLEGNNIDVSQRIKTKILVHGKDYIDLDVTNDKYLYVMKSQSGLYKIGISKDPAQRARTLSTGSGYDVSLVAVYDVAYPTRKAEAFLHKKFMKKRVLGEWFTELSIPEVEFQLNWLCKFTKIKFSNNQDLI